MPRRPYACILPTNANYLPGALAFLNSMFAYGMEQYCDVVLPFHGWDVTRLSGYGCHIVPVPLDDPCEKKEICTARMQVAIDFAPNYDALAMFDADMFLASELKLFFQIAAAGFLIASNDDTHQDLSAFVDSHSRPVCPSYSYKIICAVPFFFSKLHSERIFATALQLVTSESTSNLIGDLEGLNIAISSQPEIADRMLVLPSSQLTGVHHTAFKPESFHMFDVWDGRLPLPTLESNSPELLVLTADFQRVFCVHGQYWLPRYTDDLVRQMRWYYAEHLGMTSGHLGKWLDRVQQIADRTQKLFLVHLLHGHIPFDVIQDYVHPIQLEYIQLRAAHLGVNI